MRLTIVIYLNNGNKFYANIFHLQLATSMYLTSNKITCQKHYELKLVLVLNFLSISCFFLNQSSHILFRLFEQFFMLIKVKLLVQ